MLRYFIEGRMSVEPAYHPDWVQHLLNRHGAELSGANADSGGEFFLVSETVEGFTADEAISTLTHRLESATDQRKRRDAVQRSAIGPFVAERIGEWFPDDEFGVP